MINSQRNEHCMRVQVCAVNLTCQGHMAGITAQAHRCVGVAPRRAAVAFELGAMHPTQQATYSHTSPAS